MLQGWKKLTRAGTGDAHFVNLAHVRHVNASADGGSWLVWSDGEACFNESPEEILGPHLDPQEVEMIESTTRAACLMNALVEQHQADLDGDNKDPADLAFQRLACINALKLALGWTRDADFSEFPWLKEAFDLGANLSDPEVFAQQLAASKAF